MHVRVWRLSPVDGGLTIKRGSVCIKHTLLSINRTLSVFLCSPQRMWQLTTASNVIGRSPKCVVMAAEQKCFHFWFRPHPVLMKDLFFFQLPALSWFHSCWRMRGQADTELFVLMHFLYLFRKQNLIIGQRLIADRFPGMASFKRINYFDDKM